ncbi:hypothetical protein C5S29_08900 [ANME-1 cluster archaeon GoMg3.2]|nr:hypothetical protein [ANME-1 cluster archaeon GoMg3.2]
MVGKGAGVRGCLVDLARKHNIQLKLTLDTD